MKVKSLKAKGRRLQVEVAEALASYFDLTVEAQPPTKPGRLRNVTYVPETKNPDLRVRRSGEPGSDVVLLSDKAKQVLSIGGTPLSIECKYTEKFSLAHFLKTLDIGHIIGKGFKQAESVSSRSTVPVVFARKNRYPILCFLRFGTFVQPYLPVALYDSSKVGLVIVTNNYLVLNMRSFCKFIYSSTLS